MLQQCPGHTRRAKDDIKAERPVLGCEEMLKAHLAGAREQEALRTEHLSMQTSWDALFREEALPGV